METFSFRSRSSLEEVFNVAKLVAPALNWVIRENEYEGRYLIGRGQGAEKIKFIVLEGDGRELEVWDIADQELTKSLLLAFGALNVQKSL